MFTFVLAIQFLESCFDHNSVVIMNGYDQAIEIKNNLVSFFFHHRQSCQSFLMTKLTESYVSINFHTARIKDYPRTNSNTLQRTRQENFIKSLESKFIDILLLAGKSTKSVNSRFIRIS